MRPIVTIVVMTYNSSEFILETLDSTYKQTYENIELIISDDCSTDNTVEIVKGWIKDHSCRYVNCKLLTAQKNTGIPANINRAIKVSNGVWIKILAGDDILTLDSTENQILAVSSLTKILIGDAIHFMMNGNERVILEHNKVQDIAPYFFYSDHYDQYRYLLYHPEYGLSQSALIKKDLFYSVAMYDERYSVLEDYPFWLNATKGGARIEIVEKPVMYYRIHYSVTSKKIDELYNMRQLECMWGIKKEYIFPNIPWYDIFYFESLLIDGLRVWLVKKVFHNKRTVISRVTMKILSCAQLQWISSVLLDSFLKRKYKTQSVLE